MALLINHTTNQSHIFSVHHTVPSSTSSSSTTTTCSPGEWVRLLPIPKIDEWDDGDLSKLPPLYWTCQGAVTLLVFPQSHEIFPRFELNILQI